MTSFVPAGCNEDRTGDLPEVVLTAGQVAGSPKSAEHLTSVPDTSSAVVCQVTVFLPDSTVAPLFIMFTGMLADPHISTEQVKVTSWLPVADCGSTAQAGDSTAKHHIILKVNYSHTMLYRNSQVI